MAGLFEWGHGNNKHSYSNIKRDRMGQSGNTIVSFRDQEESRIEISELTAYELFQLQVFGDILEREAEPEEIDYDSFDHSRLPTENIDQ